MLDFLDRDVLLCNAMHRDSELKKLERRAKSMLLDKDIPPSKRDIVRTIMNNETLHPEERYSAIIELIKTCPDKVSAVQKRRKIAPPVRLSTPPLPEIPVQKRETAAAREFAPEERSIYVDSIRRKYAGLKLFKKRYLIHANNRLGLAIKKRLIPTRRLIKVFGDIAEFQGTLLARLGEIEFLILRDEAIEDPVDFNFLRRFRKWMAIMPFAGYKTDVVKWMDKKSFESEMREYVVFFFSFQKMEVAARERAITLAESRLRSTEGLQKEEIFQKDSDSVKSAKEKKNLGIEKEVHDYIMLLRSFLPVSLSDDSIVSTHLRLKYGIASFPEFLIMIMETLVFCREIGVRDLEGFYGIAEPSFSATDWDFSVPELKKYGKDPESKKRKRMETLKEALAPYERIARLIELKWEGRAILGRAFEEQWRIGDRRQKDFENVYEEDFLGFLDNCLHYFDTCFAPLLDGSLVYFSENDRRQIDGRIFLETFFMVEMKTLDGILEEMYLFKSKNPSLPVGRDEAKRIRKGKIRSMAALERLLTMTGDLFYDIGNIINELIEGHRIWAAGVRKDGDASPPERTPLEKGLSVHHEKVGRPIPWHDCRVAGFEKNFPLAKSLIGRDVLSISDDTGLLSIICAFCYQIAYVCLSDGIARDLEERKRIMRELREITGKNQ